MFLTQIKFRSWNTKFSVKYMQSTGTRAAYGHTSSVVQLMQVNHLSAYVRAVDAFRWLGCQSLCSEPKDGGRPTASTAGDPAAAAAVARSAGEGRPPVDVMLMTRSGARWRRGRVAEAGG
jgi:hypothetical protein